MTASCLNCRHAIVPYADTVHPRRHVYCCHESVASLVHHAHYCHLWMPRRDPGAQLTLDHAPPRSSPQPE